MLVLEIRMAHGSKLRVGARIGLSLATQSMPVLMAHGSKLRVGARIALSLAAQSMRVRPRLVHYEDVGRTSEDEEEMVKTTEGVGRTCDEAKEDLWMLLRRRIKSRVELHAPYPSRIVLDTSYPTGIH